MNKIPTLFKRNPNNMRELLDEVHPNCQWVLDGEGIATRKYDGTCCLVKDGVLFRRREIKEGRSIPDGFIEADYDQLTGKRVGWILVSLDDPQDKWHIEARRYHGFITNGTYELVGPKIQGNPERYQCHALLSHMNAVKYVEAPRTKREIFKWLIDKDIEGLVWHHHDGRMAKIKKKDFGMKRR